MPDIASVHDVLDALARLERDRPGAGRKLLYELSEDDADELWRMFEAEEAAIRSAEDTVTLAHYRFPEEDHR